jgi:serine/threonine-protein kinase HipA
VEDLELGSPKSFGRIEYAYSLMALAAGIEMNECKLMEENGRAHFLTKRFDRQNGNKIHMQSLCGLAHYDYNMAGAYGYEQAFAIMRKLRLSKAEAVQQFRRMVFNVVARNQDDHTKNIAFLMDQTGKWKLSPAFDMIYAHNPAGKWTNQHQMTINGKRDGFTRKDLIAVGESISIPRSGYIVDELIEVVQQWLDFAKEAGLDRPLAKEIQKHHRVRF